MDKQSALAAAVARLASIDGFAMDPVALVADLMSMQDVYGALFDSALDQTAKAIEDVVAGKVDSSQLKYELSPYRSYHYQSVRKQRQPADMRLIYQGGNGQIIPILFGSRHMPSDVYSRLLQRIAASL